MRSPVRRKGRLGPVRKFKIVKRIFKYFQIQFRHRTQLGSDELWNSAAHSTLFVEWYEVHYDGNDEMVIRNEQLIGTHRSKFHRFARNVNQHSPSSSLNYFECSNFGALWCQEVLGKSLRYKRIRIRSPGEVPT